MTLEGISKKGRERIKRDGAEGWWIERQKDRVQFSTEPGPWLFITKGDDFSSRWVHESRDKDFRIVK